MKTTPLALALIASIGLSATSHAAPAAAPPGKTKPGASGLSLRVQDPTVTFGAAARLSGKLAGMPAGTAVVLEEAAYPFAAFAPTGLQTTTDAQGGFAIVRTPRKHTRFRVRTPDGTRVSDPVEVRSLLAVGTTVSDSTPRRGQRVRFSGSVRPAHDGAAVQLQRRGTDGVFRTVARTRLRDAGELRSAYRVSLVVRSSAQFRVRVSGDLDHDAGLGRSRTLRIG